MSGQAYQDMQQFDNSGQTTAADTALNRSYGQIKMPNKSGSMALLKNAR